MIKSFFHSYHQLLIAGSITLVLLMCIPAEVVAKRDTTTTKGVMLSGRESVMFIGKMNSDTRPDTVVVRQVAGFSYLPAEIRWGASARNDSNKKKTLFRYPVLSGITGTLTFEDINKDSIADITVFIRGKKKDTSSTPASAKYSKSFILFGCNQMKNDTLIDLSLPDSAIFARQCYVRPMIGQGQQSPRFEMNHRGGNKVVSLRRGNYNCNGGSQSMLTEVQTGEKAQEYILQVFPNPVLDQLTVDIQFRAVTTVSVLRIINGYGRSIIEEAIEPVSGNKIYTYPVNNFVSGWYRAMLYDVSGGLISSIPFIVIR